MQTANTSTANVSNDAHSDTDPRQYKAPRVRNRQVSTLTEGQLNRKRAHDREAQRALRQRTKEYVERLETQLQDLSGAPATEHESELAREKERNANLTEQLEQLTSKATTALSPCIPYSTEALVGIPELPKPIHNASGHIIKLSPSLYSYPPRFGLAPYSGVKSTGAKLPGVDNETLYHTPSLDSTPHITQNTLSPTLPIRETLHRPTSFVNQPSYAFEAPPVLGFPKNDTTTLNGENTVTEWQLANEVLTSCGHLNRVSRQNDDHEGPWHNLCVRSLLDGWESIEHLVGQSPVWKTLKEVDQVVCEGFEPLERLAAIYIMYIRLNYLSNQTPENRALVPDWFLDSASPAAEKSAQFTYFLAWPGLRARMKSAPYRFSSNAFWLLFKKNFKIIWPYELRDCYRRNRMTNMYEVTPTFEHHMQNLKCWAVGPGLLKEYPELRGDIACLDEVPASLSGSTFAQFRFARPIDSTDGEVATKRRRRSPGNPTASTHVIIHTPSSVPAQAPKVKNSHEAEFVTQYLPRDVFHNPPPQPNFELDRWSSVPGRRVVDLDD